MTLTHNQRHERESEAAKRAIIWFENLIDFSSPTFILTDSDTVGFR